MEKKLGPNTLTALALSSMLGAGVPSLSRNVAAVASPAALFIGWGTTSAGILLLAFAMLILTRIRPELGGGTFTYAHEGSDELVGSCSARRYRLHAVIAGVSRLAIVFSTLNFSMNTPELRLFGDGNTWQSIVGASALLWIAYFLILYGVQTVASINLVATLVRLLSLGLFVVLAMVMSKLDTFKLDFIGLVLGIPVWEQVKNTMLITLWISTGVEGIVVVSAHTRNERDVSKATLLAILSTLDVYLLVTLLSLGVVTRPELAGIRNPLIADLTMGMTGPWGGIIIAAGLIVSICGVYLNWTIVATEIPFLVATHKVFPRIFARQNAQATPSASLWLTNIHVQICLVLIWLTGSDYNTLLAIASEMILMLYLLVGAFLLKIATRPLHRAVSVGAYIYGLWLLYTSGPMHLLLSVVLYVPGLLVFLHVRKTHTHDNMLNYQEMVLAGMLLIVSVPATWMLVGQRSSHRWLAEEITMGKAQPLPILITGGDHRIGLALVQHFINQKQPVIVSYRAHYPATDGLINAGAQRIQADFPTNDGMMALVDEVLKSAHGLRTILHNASVQMAGKSGVPLADVLACMMQIHVNTPYLFNHALERLLRGCGHAASDVTRFIGYMVERGSDEHVVYVASKAALDNMARSFARKLVPEAKVDSTALSLIPLNEHDDAEYRQQVLNKSLMKIVPGEKEVVNLVDYLLTSCFITGRDLPPDSGCHLR